MAKFKMKLESNKKGSVKYEADGQDQIKSIYIANGAFKDASDPPKTLTLEIKDLKE